MAESRRAGADRPAAPRRALVRRFLADARGATAIEYAMIGGLIFAVAAGGMRMFGSKASSVYGIIGNAMAQVN